MVDAAAPMAGTMDRNGISTSARAKSGTTVTVGSADALGSYREAAEDGVFSPAQSPLWVASWIEGTGPDVIVATLNRDGRAILSLALEVGMRGAVRTARFMSGSHANGNFAPVSRQHAETVTIDDLNTLFSAMSKARPDVDLIVFERLATDIAGVANPLLLLPARQSPNVSLAVDLQGGFDAMLARTSARRKRKKHRSQIRKFEIAGGFRRLEASTAAEVDHLLTAFFSMKSTRFAKMGIADVFAQRHVRDFFRRVFTGSLGAPRPPFVLHAIEVGGKIRAVTGSSRCHDRLICEFGAIADDDMAFASPGEFLFFDNIEEACKDGYAVYDFSVGDEHYKRLWCNLEIAQFDVMVPLTTKGRLAAAVLSATARAKTFVKNNPYLWGLVKTFRKKAAAPAESTEE